MIIEVKNILQKRVTLFNSAKSKETRNITIKDALSSFTDDTYKTKISNIRHLNSEEYSIKKRFLPAITFCGTFHDGHRKEDLLVYNNLLILDIDKLSHEEFIRVKNILSEDKYIVSYWESPSQQGVKAIVSLLYNNSTGCLHLDHDYAFREFEKYLRQTYDIILDQSGKDISRLCFISYDLNLHIKSEVESFDVNVPDEHIMSLSNERKVQGKPAKGSRYSAFIELDPKHKNPIGKNKQQNKEIILKIIKFLKKNNGSITEDYEQWFRVGHAIANSFDYTLGLRYYLKLCELDRNNHSEEESIKMLQYCYGNSKGYITFGTILHLAHQKGFINRKLSGEGGSSEKHI